ncbi:MAG: hypothetical protein L6437_14005 [Kiritimatiellae bacterium]|nr:hypothetical protein [Kiritimatiellia bacterium]
MKYRKVLVLVIGLLFAGESIYAKEFSRRLGPKAQLSSDGHVIECIPAWAEGLEGGRPNYLPRASIVEWNIPAGNPGKYKVTLRAKVEHIGVASQIWLEAWEDGGFKVDTGYGVYREPIAYDRLYGQRFTADNIYTEFGLIFRIPGDKSVHVALTYRPIAPEGNDLGKVTVEKSSLKLEQLPASVAIVEVKPDKIQYRRKESGALKIRMVSIENQQRNVKLSVDLIGEINKRYPIVSTEVLLEPQGLKTIDIPFNAPEEDGGYEAYVRASVEAKVMDENNDYFAVSDNPFKFAIVTSTVGGDEPEYQIPLFLSGSAESFSHFKEKVTGRWKEYLADVDLAVSVLRKNYVTYYEFFAWAPDDCFDLTPDGDEPFFSGQTFYISSTPQLRAIIERLHKNGIMVAAYANPVSLGWLGIEWLRRRPEWFLYNENGQLKASFDLTVNANYKAGIKTPGNVYPCFEVNNDGISPIDGRRAVDHHIDEIIASQKMFGWDAIRYDVAHWHKCIPELRRQLAKRSDPKMYIGNNTGINLCGAEPSELWNLLGADGSLVMEEATTFAHTETDPRHLFEDWIKFVVRGSDLSREAGGHYQTICSTWSNWATMAIEYAARAHPFNRGVNAPLLGNYNQFMVRYGIFFWDERIRGINNPEKIISVKSSSPLWWKQFTSERVLGEKHKQIIIPLINTPKNKAVTDPTPSPRQDNVEISLQLSDKSSVVHAYFLSPEPYTRCIPLEIKRTGKKAVVKVPTFYFWGNVLFDITGQEGGL